MRPTLTLACHHHAKQTLLDVLAGRKNQGIIEGSLAFGGQVPTRAFLRRYTGYVEQFDTLIGMLTVRIYNQFLSLRTQALQGPLEPPNSSTGRGDVALHGRAEAVNQ